MPATGSVALVDVTTGAEPDDRVAMPSTIEPETFGVDDERVPTVLWTPTAAALRDGGELVVVLRQLEDGQRALLVFTSYDALVEGCGAGQPYVSFRSEGVQMVQEQAEADVVLWDPVLAPHLRQAGEYV